MVRPTKAELISLQAKDGRRIQVIHEITSFGMNECRDFANMLLKDETTVRKLKNESKDKNEFIRDVLDNWLNRDDDDRNDPAFPRTWRALAYCVGEVGLGILAKDLRDYCKYM